MGYSRALGSRDLQKLRKHSSRNSLSSKYLCSETMSWQAYVDDHLLCELPNGGHLQHAAIVGQDGGIWAQSENFPAISSEEVRKSSTNVLFKFSLVPSVLEFSVVCCG